MSSFRSLSPLTLPFKFRRKSSSASTTASMDNYMHGLGGVAPFSSSLPPSLPSLAPLHLTRRNECTEWQASDYSDDLDWVAYDQQDKVEYATRPWLCLTHPQPSTHRSLPSLISQLAAHAPRSGAPVSYSQSPFSYASQTTYLYPQGDSAIADDCEEYDLESMDIHIRETYFATSAERGRWLSSPVAPRVRSHATPPMRGHSSPVKTLADASPLRERLRKHKSCSVHERTSTSPSAAHDQDPRCSSPLPPSSPLTSPISNLTLLCDYEGGSVLDPFSNSDDCRSLTGTPELSSLSTACTSPVEPTRTPAPHEAPTTVSAHHSTDFPYHPAHSVISHHTTPRSPKSIGVHICAPDATDFEPNAILSPLSQFELDLPEAEPANLPLSDTVNRPHPGQHLVSPRVIIEAVRSQDGPTSIQSLSMNSNREPDVSLDTGSLRANKRAKRRRGPPGNLGVRRTREYASIRSGSPSSDAKKKKGVCHASNCSEPPSKKSKLLHRRCDSERHEAKLLPKRGGTSRSKPISRSPSAAVEGRDSNHAGRCNRKAPKPAGHAQPQQSTPSPSTTPTSVDMVDAEFHASMTGMLIEALATSRATSMDASALYLVLTRAHPYLSAERPKVELLTDIAVVLEAGRTRCGMFEKVDGSGERTRHQALESRWFYVPERDEDRERASLISAIMPRQKRNETKKYKQYYYRPLDKISRWDAEDAP